MQLMGRNEEALRLLQQYNLLNDSLTALTNKNYILDLQERYETDKKEIENQRLLLENDSKSRTIKLQNNVNYLITLILLLLVGMVIIIIRNSRKVKKYSKTLEEVNEEMKKQNIRLQELNETKDKLFSIVGHDLKSPFNSLIGFLELLTTNYEFLEPQEQKEILQKLFEESNQTHALLENMLQWAMSQRGQIGFNPMICNLKEVARKETSFLQTRADKKNIKLVNLIDDEATLEADLNMLLTIIRNIVNNAIKFTSNNGEVTLSNEMHHDGITLITKDNGKGIPADVIPKLINETSYYSTTGTGNEKGTGLGLMIVKDFLRKHHASLIIESEPEKGSVFKMFFPKNIS
jgi:signal transduction histidine kinase